MTARTKRAAQTYRISVDATVCDGCGVCIFFCRPEVFELSRELSSRGVFPALVPRPEACTGCRLCELGCPQLAICLRATRNEEP